MGPGLFGPGFGLVWSFSLGQRFNLKSSDFLPNLGINALTLGYYCDTMQKGLARKKDQKAAAVEAGVVSSWAGIESLLEESAGYRPIFLL